MMMMMMKSRVGGSFDSNTSMEAFETYNAARGNSTYANNVNIERDWCCVGHRLMNFSSSTFLFENSEPASLWYYTYLNSNV